MIRIGIAGIPGSGKTTLARALAGHCGIELGLERVELISEYARRYIAKYGPITSVMDQYRILMKQTDWEDSIPNCVDIMITDSPVHAGFLYALQLRKKEGGTKEAVFVNDIFKKMNSINNPTRYSIVFYLSSDIKPKQDKVRIQQHFDEHWRTEANVDMRLMFKLFPPKKFIEIKAVSLQARIKECIGYIKQNV